MKAKGTKALFPLGAGQGYTRFALANARVEGGQVLVDVTNTGTRAGSEVVQAYLAQSPFALVGFAKLHLPAGETATAQIEPSPYILRSVAGTGPVPLVLGRDAEDAAFALELPR
jgi:beta-glucosidase